MPFPSPFPLWEVASLLSVSVLPWVEPTPPQCVIPLQDSIDADSAADAVDASECPEATKNRAEVMLDAAYVLECRFPALAFSLRDSAVALADSCVPSLPKAGE